MLKVVGVTIRPTHTTTGSVVICVCLLITFTSQLSGQAVVTGVLPSPPLGTCLHHSIAVRRRFGITIKSTAP